MKKLLPKTVNNPQGFTLVELLIVVTIIAILAVIGVVIYSGIQKTARDGRRQADVGAISNALEANYGKTTAGQYTALADTFFAAGLTPADPVNTNAVPNNACPGVCKYCFTQGAAAQARLASCASANTAVSAANGPTGGSTNPYWMICTNLEAGGVYCKGNQQ